MAPSLADPLALEQAAPAAPVKAPNQVRVASRERVEAVRGEYESIQIVVHAGEEPLAGLRLEVEAVDPTIPAPVVRVPVPVHCAAPHPRALSGRERFADVLRPAAPLDLAPGETGVFWLTYHVPREAEPGDYTNRVRVLSGEERLDTVSVGVKVYAFTLPETPSLPFLTEFGRERLSRAYGLPDVELAPWEPYYDWLARYPLSWPVWDGGALVGRGEMGEATGGLKEHLSRVMEASHMASIDLAGRGVAAFDQFARPADAMAQDPLQLYLHEMGNWLADKGWLDRSCVWLGGPGPRDAWGDARKRFFRARLADKRIPRLITGWPRDYFVRYTERYGMPFDVFSPDLVQRMRTGAPLAAFGEPRPVAARVLQGRSLPRREVLDPNVMDACDGLVHTEWRPSARPTEKAPLILELRYAEPIAVEYLNVLWAPGYESSDLEVRASYDGETFNKVTVRWEHRPPRGPYLPSISKGTLKYDRTLLALRLRMNGAEGEAVRVAEVLAGTPEAPQVEESAAVVPWLALEDCFPSLAASAHPMESRAAPWLAFLHGFEGITGGELVAWPGALGPESFPQGGPMVTIDPFVSPLTYPGTDGLLASVRLERLRDGLEDHACLRALAEAVDAMATRDSGVAALLRVPGITRQPTLSQLNRWAGLVLDRRSEVLGALERLLR